MKYSGPVPLPQGYGTGGLPLPGQGAGTMLARRTDRCQCRTVFLLNHNSIRRMNGYRIQLPPRIQNIFSLGARISAIFFSSLNVSIVPPFHGRPENAGITDRKSQ